MASPASLDAHIQFLDRWTPRRIVVAGDVMLDHHVYGHADRLAPDAPVPVLATVREEYKPGGASNVCLDLLALRCKVSVLSVIGDDAAGKRLAAQLRAAGCDTSGLIVSDDRPTTLKQNYIGLAQHRHSQKMFRVDSESRAPVPAKVADALIAAAKKALRGADALCIEDYNKGLLAPELCERLIALAKKMGVPVMVDPALITDYSKYRGATAITPNRFEAALATGADKSASDFETLSGVARKLLNDLKLDASVLTLDKEGCLLLERGKKPVHVPTVARQVYDVTGAGDMLLAMLAAAHANGADFKTSVELANTAAGLEVERFGVVPIELDEVLFSLLTQRGAAAGKVRTLDTLLPELAAHRKQGRKIAFTNGCFDILHAGHVAYLREARKSGDLLVVGLNSDASIRSIKGPDRPVNKEEDRVLVLSELQSVDYVVLFGEDTPINLIRAIRPDTLVKGADYRKEQVVGGAFVEKHGGKVVLVPLVEGRSTTNIIRRIGAKTR